ncbi:MAG: ADP-forming succinate--CoA ligase subunit beta, partial [Rhodoferax sp.]|uniref:ADP-forming succinate--CoA ligase subunit beta n=1 Tax=Rhodoferax sp. TaxID=50421 RepID=UPI00272FEC13
QAKEIFARHGLPVPPGAVAATVGEAVALAGKYGLPVMVKSQVLTGGRGKAGGVKFCKTIDDVKENAAKILGMDIKGHIVRKVLVTPALDIASEFYVGMLIDRASQRVLLMCSAEGGVDIEQVAQEKPEAILKHPIDPRYGLLDHEALELGLKMCPGDVRKARQLASAMQKLYTAFLAADASLAEINPFIFTPDGIGHAIDGKVSFVDIGMYRHADYEAMRDIEAEDPAERQAREANLSFVKLEGNVGCLVNGAGLAMATMDTIKLFGAEPANFLDVGGGATPEKVTEAFKIMLKNPKVEAILVNIFGGIMKCDTIATGVITACKATNLNVPLVVRMKGTNEELGKKMLKDSGLPIISVDTMAEAAQAAVKAVAK